MELIRLVVGFDQREAIEINSKRSNAFTYSRFLIPYLINCDGEYLHRFIWLDEKDNGELPTEWSWLSIEYPTNPKEKLIDYTVGMPCFNENSQSEMSEEWNSVVGLTMSRYIN